LERVKRAGLLFRRMNEKADGSFGKLKNNFGKMIE
jgi:hypothetical protein